MDLLDRPVYETMPDDLWVLDGGACVGDFAVACLELPQVVKVACVECEAENYAKLSERFAFNEKVTVLFGALVHSAVVADIPVWKMPDRPQWHTTMDQRYPSMRLTEPCPPVHIAEILSHHPEGPWLVKLDIEGREAEVLADLTPELAAHIDQITVEAHPGYSAVGDVAETLAKLGFTTEIHKLDVLGYRK